jgi:bifunctional DNA-binding transcriptional regulator/antitoxin component of YhaV-PrlF toxin-antitoxin module
MSGTCSVNIERHTSILYGERSEPWSGHHSFVTRLARGKTLTYSTRRFTVPKARVRAGREVKIPASIATKYHLKDGDVLDVLDVGGSIIFVPEKVKQNPKLRKDLNERLWDHMEEEASEAIARGEVIGPFDDLDEALKALKTSRV